MKSLRQSVRSVEKKAFSFTDIEKITKPHVSVAFKILDDIGQKATTASIFKGKKTAAILCTIHNPHGEVTSRNHWVALIKRGEKRFDFCDSLGHTPAKLASKLHIHNAGFIAWCNKQHINSQTIPIQRDASDVSTCACHVATRLCMHELNNRQYVHWLKHGLIGDTDLTVSMLCFLGLLKNPSQQK